MDAKENKGVDWKWARSRNRPTGGRQYMIWCTECDAATYHTIDGCVICKEYEEVCNETMALEKPRSR